MNYEAHESLPKTMPAIVCYGPEDYRYKEWDVPIPGPGEVVLKVKQVGICASDLKCYQGAPLFWGDADRVGYCQPPVIAGHEFVGVVTALGEGAGEKFGLKLGDHATSEPIVPCRKCRYCKRGQFWMCDNGHDVYGFRQNTYGAMAEYIKLPANAINHKVPDEIPFDQAVYIEPLSCGIHAVERADIQLDDVVVISGCGPLGVAMVATARLKNPRLIIALDLKPHRLELAKACGADVVMNPLEVDVVDEVRKLSDGYGCDVYIEVTGNPVSVNQGLQMIARLGRFVEYSVFKQPVTVDWTIIGDTKELDIRGAHACPNTFPIAMNMLLKKQIPIERIVTHALPLEKFHEGVELVADGTQSVKVTLTP